jgi:hypothetical protein
VAVNVVPVRAPKYGFGAVDHNGTVLRIDERHAQPLGRLVAFGADRALKGVASFDPDAIAWCHGQHRVRIRTDGVMEFALQRLGKVVQDRLFRPTDPAARHDRLVGPLSLR